MKFKELINRNSFLRDKFKNLEDYLIPEIPTPPIPANVAGANPNPQVIQTAQQPTVTQQGLTETEKIYLSPEEQQIVLRQRGMIT